jgi:hypothetical protein
MCAKGNCPLAAVVETKRTLQLFAHCTRIVCKHFWGKNDTIPNPKINRLLLKGHPTNAVSCVNLLFPYKKPQKCGSVLIHPGILYLLKFYKNEWKLTSIVPATASVTKKTNVKKWTHWRMQALLPLPRIHFLDYPYPQTKQRVSFSTSCWSMLDRPEACLNELNEWIEQKLKHECARLWHKRTRYTNVQMSPLQN